MCQNMTYLSVLREKRWGRRNPDESPRRRTASFNTDYAVALYSIIS
jgi:hypothetical protein